MKAANTSVALVDNGWLDAWQQWMWWRHATKFTPTERWKFTGQWPIESMEKRIFCWSHQPLPLPATLFSGTLEWRKKELQRQETWCQRPWCCLKIVFSGFKGHQKLTACNTYPRNLRERTFKASMWYCTPLKTIAPLCIHFESNPCDAQRHLHSSKENFGHFKCLLCVISHVYKQKPSKKN